MLQPGRRLVVYYKSKARSGYVGKHTVSLVLVVTQEDTVGQVRPSRNQSTLVYVIVRSVGVGRVLCACVNE